jgi:hypothetical protein
MPINISDAIGAVEWGESQLPIFGNRFAVWKATNVYYSAEETDPPSNRLAAVASAKKAELPATFHAELGAIIGSFRSALDLLAAAIAASNGRKPSSATHFPVFRSHQDMIDPLEGIEGKKWLSADERSIIKSLCPYDGGNEVLWALHQLDILRKHEKLVTTAIYPRADYVVGQDIRFPDRCLRNLKDRPVIFTYPRNISQPEAQFSTEIVFDEIGLQCVNRKPVFPALNEFQKFVTNTINRFDEA